MKLFFRLHGVNPHAAYSDLESKLTPYVLVFDIDTPEEMKRLLHTNSSIDTIGFSNIDDDEIRGSSVAPSYFWKKYILKKL